jgi:hypothetical protein
MAKKNAKSDPAKEVLGTDPDAEGTTPAPTEPVQAPDEELTGDDTAPVEEVETPDDQDASIAEGDHTGEPADEPTPEDQGEVDEDHKEDVLLHKEDLGRLAKALRQEPASVKTIIEESYNLLGGAIIGVGECDSGREHSASLVDYTSDRALAEMFESHAAKIGDASRGHKSLSGAEWRAEAKACLCLLGRVI